MTSQGGGAPLPLALGMRFTHETRRTGAVFSQISGSISGLSYRNLL